MTHGESPAPAGTRRAFGVVTATVLMVVAVIILAATGCGRNRDSEGGASARLTSAAEANASPGPSVTPWRYGSQLRPCDAFVVAPLEELLGVVADPRRDATDGPLKGCVVGFGTRGVANLMVEVNDHAEVRFNGLKAVAQEEDALRQVPSGCQDSYVYVDSLLGPRLACLDGNLYLTVGWTQDALPSGGDDQAVLEALGRMARKTLANLRTP